MTVWTSLTRKAGTYKIIPQTFKLFILSIITINSFYFSVDYKLAYGRDVSRLKVICQCRHDFLPQIFTMHKLTLTYIAMHCKLCSKRCNRESKCLSQALLVIQSLIRLSNHPLIPFCSIPTPLLGDQILSSSRYHPSSTTSSLFPSSKHWNVVGCLSTETCCSNQSEVAFGVSLMIRELGRN